MKEKYSKCFIIIAVISITSLLISNITSVKIISIGKIILPSSALLFPITYIVGDVISEVYGYKKAKFIIMLGFIMNAFMVLFFTLSIYLKASDTWSNQEAYKIILGTTPRMFIASVSAFLLGSISNAYVLDLIKRVTKGKKLWLRTIGSTVVGELLDTLVFAVIGFSNILDVHSILVMILCQYVWKVSYEIIATPLTYLAVNKIKGIEGV